MHKPTHRGMLAKVNLAIDLPKFFTECLGRRDVTCKYVPRFGWVAADPEKEGYTQVFDYCRDVGDVS